MMGLGDKGQRYEVWGKDRETGEWDLVGWQTTPKGRVLTLVRKWPKFIQAKVVDRHRPHSGAAYYDPEVLS